MRLEILCTQAALSVFEQRQELDPDLELSGEGLKALIHDPDNYVVVADNSNRRNPWYLPLDDDIPLILPEVIEDKGSLSSEKKVLVPPSCMSPNGSTRFLLKTDSPV